MKTNLTYYPHRTDAHRHPKFKMLRSLYGNGAEGWAAEGRFWALNNFIAESTDCKLDLTKKRNKGVLADELGMSLTEFDHFIRVLKSSDIELITEIETNIFVTKKVEETYQATQSEREKARERKLGKGKSNFSGEKVKSSGELLESSGEPNNKLNKTKLKETKKEVVEQGSAAAASDASLLLEEEGKYVPNFEDVQEIKLSIISLFKKFCNKPAPNPSADIKPVMDFIFDKRPEMTVDICFEVVVNSFICLVQAERTDTGYLIGIIRRKKEEKYREILQEIKRNEINKRSYAAIQSKKTSPDEYEKAKAHQLNQYREFYVANPDMFSDYEKTDIETAFKENNMFAAGALILPKMEEVVL